MTTQTILIILFSVLIVATIFILLVFKEKKSNTDSYKKAKSTQNRKRQTTSLGYTADEVRNKRYILTGYLGTQNRFYSDYVKNLNILLRQEERIRIQNIGEFDDRISITVDFHNLTVSQAGSLYNRLIKACKKDVVYLSAIHGYNNGTAIKEMIEKKHSEKISSIIPDEINPGQTLIIINAKPLS